MFFKTVFALYFAAIALATPKSGLVDVAEVGMFRVNSRPLCTILSKHILMAMVMAMTLLKTSPRTWTYFKGIGHPPFLVI